MRRGGAGSPAGRLASVDLLPAAPDGPKRSRRAGRANPIGGAARCRGAPPFDAAGSSLRAARHRPDMPCRAPHATTARLPPPMRCRNGRRPRPALRLVRGSATKVRGPRGIPACGPEQRQDTPVRACKPLLQSRGTSRCAHGSNAARHIDSRRGSLGPSRQAAAPAGPRVEATGRRSDSARGRKARPGRLRRTPTVVRRPQDRVRGGATRARPPAPAITAMSGPRAPARRRARSRSAQHPRSAWRRLRDKASA